VQSFLLARRKRNIVRLPDTSTASPHGKETIADVASPPSPLFKSLPTTVVIIFVVVAVGVVVGVILGGA
jgi:hypothetical protein